MKWRSLSQSDTQAECQRLEAVQRLKQRLRTVTSKLDRGYEDYVNGIVSEDLWTCKSEQWEEERRTTEREISRIGRPNPSAAATGEKILELAKSPLPSANSQSSAEQRRLLDAVLSNCTFDRGSVCPTYAKPFDLFAQGNETGNWRRERDSNPRHGFPCSGFQDHRHRPLGHPSARFIRETRAVVLGDIP